MFIEMQRVRQNVGPTIERKQELNKYPDSQDSRFGPLQKVLNRNHTAFFFNLSEIFRTSLFRKKCN